MVRRYFAKLERRRMLAMKEYNSEAPGRHGFFVDAKLVWISAPFVAFAAAALFIGGRFLSRRKGLDYSLFLTRVLVLAELMINPNPAIFNYELLNFVIFGLVHALIF